MNPKLKAKILESLGSHFNTVELLWERKKLKKQNISIAIQPYDMRLPKRTDSVLHTYMNMCKEDPVIALHTE